ncbi:MAG: TRAP transporter TatT component family protein [Spirochaetales bacterium]|nr:TRAP transporter TatT component family protein [Spirochaetales bacterium]
MKKSIHFYLIVLLAVTGLFASCRSVEKMAVNKLSDMLSSDSGTGAFTRDDDPRLIADALPFTMKMYELLMDMNPEDPALKLAAGKVFIMYANGFIQTPASMMEDDDFLEQEMMMERARKMYLRGRNYVLESLYLEIKDGEQLLEMNPDGFLQEAGKDQVDALYWAAAGWLGAFSCNPFDMELGQTVHLPVAFLFRALDLDEEYGSGSIHDLMVTLWASLPPSIIENALLTAPEAAGDFEQKYYDKFNVSNEEEDRARFHFARAVALSEGMNPSTYISLATSYSVKNQDYPEFEKLLSRALAIDPYEDPDNQLLVIIYQEKARWLLDHREDFFLIDF